MAYIDKKVKRRHPTKEEIDVYNAINNAKDKSGVYHIANQDNEYISSGSWSVIQ